MKAITKIHILTSLLLLFILTSCNDDLSGTLKLCSVDIRLSTKQDEPLPSFSNAVIRFKNLSSGTITDFSHPMPADATILPGLYDVLFEGEGNGMEYYGVEHSREIMSSGCLITIPIYANKKNDDLIISEIFFTGTLQTSGNQYYGDDYVKLYNNTDHVIYADGITLFESKFLTTEKRIYTPDRMQEGVTVHALYTIPGNGKEHPVAPGEYLLIADTGIDHRQVNPNSFDLSHADWEWYDVSSVPSNLDIDSRTVPNLDKWYCYTNSIFMLHNRGYRTVGIARISSDKDTFLSENIYNFDYEIVTAVGTFPMSGNGYFIPNDDIIDVVNCSVGSEWQWNVTDSSLDRGWTSCGKIAGDKTRYFKAVRRKLLYITDDKRCVFKDTNNSTEDFNANVIPSEIELQCSVCDIDGTKAQAVTYDGVTVIE